MSREDDIFRFVQLEELTNKLEVFFRPFRGERARFPFLLSFVAWVPSDMTSAAVYEMRDWNPEPVQIDCLDRWSS